MANPYPIGQVVGVEIYRQDVVVKRSGATGGSPDLCRGEIVEFTKRSRQRLAFIACNTDIEFTSMITLTYPKEYPQDGQVVKRHFRAFLQALRRKVEHLFYLWFIEFQKRGAPHYHVLVRGLPVNDDTKEWCSQTWYRICESGDEKHLRAGTRLEQVRKPGGARRYAVKYSFKMAQKRVPEAYRNVGRFWGHSKGVKPEAKAEIECNEDDIVAGLEMGEWRWLRGDTIWYRVLYGAAKVLTSHFECDTLSLAKEVEPPNGGGC